MAFVHVFWQGFDALGTSEQHSARVALGLSVSARYTLIPQSLDYRDVSIGKKMSRRFR